MDLALPAAVGTAAGRAQERWVPLRTAGVYIPGGRAFYPSTLAMTVIPAQVAGVTRIVGVTPPRPEGPDPLVLATAALLGLEELYTVGGAQAVAWLAYGEPSVDIVTGPGQPLRGRGQAPAGGALRHRLRGGTHGGAGPGGRQRQPRSGWRRISWPRRNTTPMRPRC